MPSNDPTQRRLIAQRAALIRWSKEDPTPNVTRARTAFLDRFRREVEAEGVFTDPQAVERAAQRRLRAHMNDLADKSAQARRRRGAA